jgi:dihydropteroate synthase
MHNKFQIGRYRFSMGGANYLPLVMGILNITPDSFSDGGRHYSLEAALSHAEQMITEGVDIIDIGGESTRPGAQPLSTQEELDRVMPVLYALRDCGKPISLDTYKPEVMREAILAGVDMINDINGFRATGALSAVKEGECALCIMHMAGSPQTMQSNPHYTDVVAEVSAFLQERIQQAGHAGIARERLCIDPGFGFGKDLTHNVTLLKNLKKIHAECDVPLLVGLSRKSTIGAITGKPTEERLAGSLAAALAAVAQGANIIRVHDVAQTRDALKVWQVLTQNT